MILQQVCDGQRKATVVFHDPYVDAIPPIPEHAEFAGLKSVEQCEVRATDRGEFYFAVIQQPGCATAEVLPELIYAAMTALPWPKSMRYPASSLRWVRPLNSVICLFDGAVLKLPALGEVPVGRVTRGHRFLAPGDIEVADASDYRAKLAKARANRVGDPDKHDWNRAALLLQREGGGRRL